MAEKTLEERVKDLEMQVMALNAMNTNLIVRAERAELAVEELEVAVEILSQQVPHNE